MKKLFASMALALLVVLPSAPRRAFGQYILNSAVPQNAQMNIGTATVRGTITVTTMTATYLNATNFNITNITGNGSLLTNLNASNLGSGTTPTGRLTGSYAGITGVGTITAGTWNASTLGTQYGGTGQNWVATSTGNIPYFSGVGVLAPLAPGSPLALLQTNGSAAPSWTSAPQVSGANLYGIALNALNAGTLPTNITVSSTSIPVVAGASVLGNISGAAGSYTGTVQLSQLANGTLPISVVASSITVTGVTPGTYGNASHVAQVTFGADGRATGASNSAILIAIDPSQINAGTLPSNVLVPAANINAGALGGGVIASSLTATGISAATYGNATNSAQVTFGADGRATLANNVPISGVPPGGAAGGSLAGTYPNPTIVNSGVTPATYGSATQSAQCTFGADGRATSCANVTITGGGGGGGTSPGGANTNVQFNNSGSFGGSSNFIWNNATSLLTILGDTQIGGTTITPTPLYVQSNQGGANYVVNVSSQDASTVLLGLTSLGNATIHGSLVTGAGVSATTFTGSGAGLTALTPGNISAGSLPATVIASSIAASGVVAGSFGDASHSPQITVSGDGRITAISSATITANTVPAAGVQAGTLGASVIASSVAVSAVGTPQIAALAVTAAKVANNTLTNGQMASGTFSNITVPAANVAAGSLGATVIASSVAANGVAIGTFGDSTDVAQITVGADGRITTVTNVAIAGGGNFVSKTGDTMTGNLFVSGSTITASGPIISTGTLGNVVYSGAGTRFMWVPSSSSIRAGGITGHGSQSGAEWNPVNVGGFSVAFGRDGWAPGSFSTVGGGDGNNAGADYTTVGGGTNNSILGNGSNVTYATIAGGKSNTISGTTGQTTPSNNSFIGGGELNTINAADTGHNSDHSVIAGGFTNSVASEWNTVGGGELNVIDENSNEATIAGGRNNSIAWSVSGYIGGGRSNAITGTSSPTAIFSTIGGGSGNLITNGRSTIPGGANNTANGAYSFAAGDGATTNNTGSFVWCDNNTANCIDTKANEVNMTANGGFVWQLNSTSTMAYTSNGHLSFSGSGTSVSSCGSTPNGSVVGNDNRGIITIGGGAVTACTLNFNANFSNPVCNVNTNSATSFAVITSTAPSNVVIGLSVALGGGKLFYHCDDYK